MIRLYYCLFLVFVSGAPVGAAPAIADDATRVSGTRSGEWELVGKLSLFNPIAMKVRDEEGTVPWDEGAASSPTFAVGMATPLFLWGEVQGFAEASAGWGYKKSLQRVISSDGSSEERRLIELHRFPLLGAMKFVYRIGGRGQVKPSLTLGAGVQGWFQGGVSPQTRSLQWVPYYVIAPSLTFFEREWEQDWFAGFTFGVSYQNGFRSKTFSAWSFDLSLNILVENM